MVGLLDIAPSFLTVQGVTVSGISARGVVALLQDFPALKEVLAGREAKGLNGATVLELAPDAAAAIIAAGTGNPGNDEHKKAADLLPLGTQVEFLDAIVTLTFPTGVGPFVATLEKLGVIPKDIVDENFGKEAGTK